MCGIVGYVGASDSLPVLLGGLKRLEYRGYDSAGVAIVTESGGLATRKRAGKLSVLVDDVERAPLACGTTGIGHTRWATHGAPNDENAHPHLSADGKLALIHNGIIENFATLKQELLDEGYTFTSETDTEVAAKLIGRAFEHTKDLVEAVREVVVRFTGAFTLLIVHTEEPDLVVGVRRNSPLVVGLGDGENFFGSDVAAFVAHTQRAASVGQDEIVAIRPEGVRAIDYFGNEVRLSEYTVSWDARAAEKGGWTSFMKKEISEQADAVSNTLMGRTEGDSVVLSELGELDGALSDIHRIVVIACGTASYAGMLGKYAIEAWARIPVEVMLSHEFRYSAPVVDEHTLVLSISQSGETMDTLMAVKYAIELGARTLSVCNTQGATIARESDAVLYTHAGPEVAVASTKAFTAQVIALYLFGLRLGEIRGTMPSRERRRMLDQLAALPAKIETVIATSASIEQLAHWMSDSRAVLFLGRHVGFPVALEGALKLKELAYIHAEGFAAGELKHGPIALIEPGQPVFVIVPSPRSLATVHAKVISNIQEIRARGARVLAIAEAGDAAVLPYADEVIPIPLTDTFLEPLLAVIPLQVFAMELASAKGLDVDQPRNLAKSVTVE